MTVDSHIIFVYKHTYKLNNYLKYPNTYTSIFMDYYNLFMLLLHHVSRNLEPDGD